MSTKRPKLAQVGRQMGQDEHQKAQVGSSWPPNGARWAPGRARRVQERPKLVPSWSKMGQEGGKMGTQTGQEGAREAQVGPKSGQKKRDPNFNDFWATFGACFKGFFVLQAVF